MKAKENKTEKDNKSIRKKMGNKCVNEIEGKKRAKKQRDELNEVKAFVLYVM